MKDAQAKAIQKEIEDILERYDIHFKTENVCSPKLKFINITISIKITKE